MTFITDKLKRYQLRWYEHILRWPVNALTRKVEGGRSGKDRPKSV